MSNILSQLNGVLTRGADWFMPVSLLHARSSRGLARVFIITHLSGSLVGLALLVYLLRFEAALSVGVGFVVAMTGMFVALPLALRRTGNMALVTLASFQALTITSLVGTFEYGGFASPFLPWLLVSLMSGLFYQAQRTGLVLGLFVANLVVFLGFLVFRAHPGIPEGVDLTLLGWVSISIAMSYMAYMALYYARLIAARTELEVEAERNRAVAAELEQAKAVAEGLSRNRSIFFAKMSHELRTPLNAIIGYSEILAEEYGDIPNANPQPLADLNRINATGRHLLSLVSEVLDVNAVENIDNELELKSLTLGEILDSVLATSEPLVNINHNKLVVDCPLRQDTITTDARKLRQMLINLMSNASKFTSNGTITLELWVERAAQDDRLHAAVLDTGIGIAADVLPGLFETYRQADSTIQGRFGGTGIGLALTRKYAALLGGTISVDSQVGRGSCFRLDLPAVTKTPETAAPEVAPMKLAS